MDLVIARFGMLALAVGLFGAACFPLYVPWVERPRAPTAIRISVPAVAAVAGLVWLLGLWSQTPAAADYAGLALFAFATPSGLGLSAAVAICLLLTGLAFAPQPPAKVRALITGGLLVSLAFVGHASTIGGFAGATRVAVMALHLLFAGVWLGGLFPLIAALRTGAEPERTLRAFGKMAIGAVFALATTGLVVAAVVVSLAGGPPGKAYLTAFGVKLALVLGLGAVASLNRWGLTPLAARNPAGAKKVLWWSLATEQLLAFALLAVVAQLGLMDPAF
ncbi:CopD family protein [Phenylobacterium sp. LjRoot219]|uniref:CopD family protein n=1 Tax=Phenylobacterium sp. LjRoot219 TaxID=3342283 RepID=UPI003ECDE331